MKKSKKFISLVLIFSLVMLSANLYAKERRGATLIVIKNDGQQIEGELITVKPNSLLLLNTEGKDESIDIADIKVITIVKKSKALVGATFGAFAGGGIGAVVVPLIGKPTPIIFSSMAAEKKTILSGLFFGFIIGAVGGGLIGASEGTDKTIQIEGMTDLEIQKTLEKLRKKARIRNYK
jgi:hypothetical protein